MTTPLHNSPHRTTTSATTDAQEIPQRPGVWPQTLAQSDYPPAEAVLPLDSPQPSAPTWLNLLLGQFILRACPSGSKVESCKGCQLQPLCQCAHGRARAAAVVEANFWLVVAFSVGLALFCLLTSALHRP